MCFSHDAIHADAVITIVNAKDLPTFHLHGFHRQGQNNDTHCPDHRQAVAHDGQLRTFQNTASRNINCGQEYENKKKNVVY